MSIINAQTRVSGWRNYFQRFDKDYPWANKIRKVFWRGTLSESDPAKVRDSIRWRVSKFVADRGTQLYDVFDIGLTQIPEYVISMAGIKASEAGGLKNEVTPMINFQKYLAILDMDGNSWSSRFSNLLCYNSVVLKVEPGFVDDFYYHLVPCKWRTCTPKNLRAYCESHTSTI
jgi:Glycosyl transferase family 90